MTITPTRAILGRVARSIDLDRTVRNGGLADPWTTDTVTVARTVARDTASAEGMFALSAIDGDRLLWIIARVVAANDDLVGLRFLRRDGSVGLGVTTRPTTLRVPLKAFRSSPITEAAADALTGREVLLRNNGEICHLTVLEARGDVLSGAVHVGARRGVGLIDLRRDRLAIPLLPFML